MRRWLFCLLLMLPLSVRAWSEPSVIIISHIALQHIDETHSANLAPMLRAAGFDSLTQGLTWRANQPSPCDSHSHLTSRRGCLKDALHASRLGFLRQEASQRQRAFALLDWTHALISLHDIGEAIPDEHAVWLLDYLNGKNNKPRYALSLLARESVEYRQRWQVASVIQVIAESEALIHRGWLKDANQHQVLRQVEQRMTKAGVRVGYGVTTLLSNISTGR